MSKNVPASNYVFLTTNQGPGDGGPPPNLQPSFLLFEAPKFLSKTEKDNRENSKDD